MAVDLKQPVNNTLCGLLCRLYLLQWQTYTVTRGLPVLWKTIQSTNIRTPDLNSESAKEEDLLAKMLTARILILGDRSNILESRIDWLEFFLWLGIKEAPLTDEDLEEGQAPVSKQLKKIKKWLRKQPVEQGHFNGPIMQVCELIAERMQLSKYEKIFLCFLWLKIRHDCLHQAIEHIETNSSHKGMAFIEQLFLMPASSLFGINFETHPLIRFMLLDTSLRFKNLDDCMESGHFLHLLDSSIALDDESKPLADQLDKAFEGICPKVSRQVFSPKAFSYVPQLQFMRDYLTQAIKEKKCGINILLYGRPGVGKTLLASSLADWLKCDLYSVPVEDSDGDMTRADKRIERLVLGQVMLKNKQNTLFLFDEIEDAFLSLQRSPPKAWLNKQLESNPVPTIWISNEIRMLDAAYLRRFDLILEIPIPDTLALQHHRVELLEPLPVTLAFKEWLAESNWVTPALINQLNRLGELQNTRQPVQNQKTLLALLEQRHKAEDHPLPKDWFKPVVQASKTTHQLSFPEYNQDWLNTDPNLSRVVRQIKRIGNARLCLHGHPGTGKSAFAGYLAKQLDRPLLFKSASSLLDKYIGETEKLLAEMFAEATAKGAILLLDEADSFITSRQGNDLRSWEVSMVNEMLVQMEAYNGIFIATSNRFQSMDSAVMRRFDLKVSFDWLTSSQLKDLLTKILICHPIEKEAIKQLPLARLESLKVSPGNVQTAMRRLQLQGKRIQLHSLLLALEAEAAAQQSNASRPIGFVHSGQPISVLANPD